MIMGLCTCMIFVCFNFHLIYGLCTYPSDIRGTWRDSVYGTIIFSNSYMYMQTKGFLSGTSSTNFSCHMSTDNLYISKSVATSTLGIVGGIININVYICMEFTVLTSSASYYYYLKSRDAYNLNFGDVVPILSSTSPLQTDVCNTSPDIREFHMLVFPSSASLGMSKCPVPFLGDFTYTMNFGTGATQCGSKAFWNGCSNTSVISLNNTACGTQYVGFSSGGYLGCVYSVQDATTRSIYYVGVYNFDPSINGASTKRFTCFAVQQSSGLTNVSQSPDKCTSTQSPSSLPSNGALLQLTTVSSCAPVSADVRVPIGVIFAIIFSVMSAIFIALVIGICIYRQYIKSHQVKIVIIPKVLPRGAHTVLTMSDTSTVVNKEIITEPKLVIKPIRNGQPQSMELQQWKHNSEFQEPGGQLKLVTKPQPPVEKIDTMKSRVATQMREESERKRNMALVIDRVKTNLDRELRVISALKAKQALNREATSTKLSQATTLAPPKSQLSQYIHDPRAKSRTNSMRTQKVTNGTVYPTPHDNSFNLSFQSEPRTSTPLSVRPSSIDMMMSETNLSVFSVDLKYRANKTPKPQPDITVTKKIRDTKKFPAIRELSNMPGELNNFER